MALKRQQATEDAIALGLRSVATGTRLPFLPPGPIFGMHQSNSNPSSSSSCSEHQQQPQQQQQQQQQQATTFVLHATNSHSAEPASGERDVRSASSPAAAYQTVDCISSKFHFTSFETSEQKIRDESN